ncbi:SGNH/GDSL hydrolase family protein [Paraferrimonas sp. SM1919]|uniref:SGNH/GDSL hydrolase family protein n=1 Tax=Paraferrimonas sp. SM1919 TaxID=2662263 RepID=UPI0013D20B56|nr:SGNH/GDSL hydrolase family protein [Paraferrimonas sp. SM1919]
MTNNNKDIVLIGDSIFDNQPYVGEGESVISQLKGLLADKADAHLLALDGAINTDIPAQLEALKRLGADNKKVFMSISGNDFLRYRMELETAIRTGVHPFVALDEIKQRYQATYAKTLKQVMAVCDDLTVCTVYNQVPGLTVAEQIPLGVLNEVLLQQAMANDLPILDLRTLCDSKADYAPVSPIEPSKFGAYKIAKAITAMAGY